MPTAQPESAPRVIISPGLHTSEHPRELHEGVKTNLDKLNEVFGLKQDFPVRPPAQETVAKEGLMHILSLPKHELSPFTDLPRELKRYIPEPLIPLDNRSGSEPSVKPLAINTEYASKKSAHGEEV